MGGVIHNSRGRAIQSTSWTCASCGPIQRRGMGCDVVSHYTVALSRDGCELGGIQSELKGKVSTIGRLPFGHHDHGQILIVIRVNHKYKANFNEL